MGKMKESSACIQKWTVFRNVSEEVFRGARVLPEGAELPSAPLSSIVIWTVGVLTRHVVAEKRCFLNQNVGTLETAL